MAHWLKITDLVNRLTYQSRVVLNVWLRGNCPRGTLNVHIYFQARCYRFLCTGGLNLGGTLVVLGMPAIGTWKVEHQGVGWSFCKLSAHENDIWTAFFIFLLSSALATKCFLCHFLVVERESFFKGKIVKALFIKKKQEIRKICLLGQNSLN